MQKPQDAQEALENLGEIIDTLTQELELYAKRPQPNMGYISKQNTHIQQLTHIYNALAALEYYDTWLSIEKAMLQSEAQEPNPKGFIITMHLNPNGGYYNRIANKPFEK